jgi:hypothetical protein
MRLLLATALFFLSGCALRNTHLYASDELPKSDQAVLSSVGIYAGGSIGLQITSINGKTVDLLKTASFIVPPGTYDVVVHVNKDLQVTASGAGLAVTKQQADVAVKVTVQGGRTYVPDARINGDMVAVHFDDKGLAYPTECLPLYVAVNSSSNPGHRVYATGKRCEI